MKIHLIITAVLWASSAAANDMPDQVVRSYLAAYSNGVSGTDLVNKFWMPTLIVNAPGAAASQIPAATFAISLETFRANEMQKGWQRSHVNQLQSCILRTDLALISVDYERQYDDGRALPDAVVYTLTKRERWRLSSVTPVDIHVPIRCDKHE